MSGTPASRRLARRRPAAERTNTVGAGETPAIQPARRQRSKGRWLMLSLHNLSYSYTNSDAVRDVTFNLGARELVGVPFFLSLLRRAR